MKNGGWILPSYPRRPVEPGLNSGLVALYGAGGRKDLYRTGQPESFPEGTTNYPLISLSDESMTRSFYRQLFLDHDAELKPDTEAATTDQMLAVAPNGRCLCAGTHGAGRCSVADRPAALQEIIPSRSICGLRPPPT